MLYPFKKKICWQLEPKMNLIGVFHINLKPQNYSTGMSTFELKYVLKVSTKYVKTSTKLKTVVERLVRNQDFVIDINTGVTQGSELGPLLFNSYVNDEGDIIIEGKQIMFAYDSTIVVMK